MFFSYSDYNYRYSEGFQRYSKHVPSYLKNRPRDLVLTCLNRFEAAKNLDKTGIVQVESGEFSVISHTDVIRYRVSFRNDENMPYCTCFSWKKSYYPCKHFFAVFLKFPNWSWDTLSPLYVNSPFLQLDIYSKEKECSAAEDSSHEPSNAENIEKEGNHSDETLQREEKQEGGKEERGNNLVDLPPTKS